MTIIGLPAVWWGPANVAMSVAAAAALLLICAGRWLPALAAVALAVMAAVPIASVGEAAFTPDAAANTPVCEVANGIQVCLARRHAAALPLVVSEVKRMWQGLDGMPRVHDQFLTGSPNDADPGVLYLNTLYLGNAITAGPEISVIRESLSGPSSWNCSQQADDVWGLSLDVASWMQARPAPPPLESALAGVPEEQRPAAVSRFVTAVRACDAEAARAAFERP